jgi:hypothetical protein
VLRSQISETYAKLGKERIDTAGALESRREFSVNDLADNAVPVESRVPKFVA